MDPVERVSDEAAPEASTDAAGALAALEEEVRTLRRENARLARARLGKAGSAAASALGALTTFEARYAALEERLRAAEQGWRDAEAQLSARDAPARPVPRLVTETEAVEARPLDVGPDGDPNSWEQRRRRAEEVLIPWIEQAVPLAGRTVLEYGCGNAAVSCAVAAHAGQLIGLDIDPAAVDQGRRHVQDRGLTNVELECHPVDQILAAASGRHGEVDVFLLYAVLEHLTVSERLALLRVAREVVREDGAIVVCETPNRLIYFDHHTARMPFFHLLPDELALHYRNRSERPEFTGALDAASAGGEEAALEAVARWGRGVSFHEFEVVFGERLDRHVIASSYDTLLLGERPIHPEETVLARYLARHRPDLAPAWSRYWLDVILSPVPVTRRPPFIWPWTAETTDSDGVAWTAWDNLLLRRAGARLGIALPQPTSRVLIGSVTLDGRWLDLRLRPHGSDEALVSHHLAPAHTHAFTSFALPSPSQHLDLETSDDCYVVFVGYEA